jgi:hypothetical protein
VNVPCRWDHNPQARGTCSGLPCHHIHNPNNYQADRRSGPSNMQSLRSFLVYQDVSSTVEARALGSGFGVAVWHETTNQHTMLCVPAVCRSSGAKTGSRAKSAARTDSLRSSDAMFLALNPTEGILGAAVDCDAQGDLLSRICPGWRASVTISVPPH